LAALYHERWRSKLASMNSRTHLRGAQDRALRSKDLRIWCARIPTVLLMAHFPLSAVLMHEAALKADEDPDRLSFLHAVRGDPPQD